MNARNRIASLAVAAAALLAASPARADLVLKRTVREFGPRPAPKAEAPAEPGAADSPAPTPAPAPATEAAPAAPAEIVELSSRRCTVKMAAGKLRETSEDGRSATILRSDLGLMWLLADEKGKKTYREVTFKALNAAADSGRERLSRRLPMVGDPAMRAKVEAMLAGGEPAEGGDAELPPLAIERPGTKKEIAGESCELVVVKVGPDELFRAFLSERRAPAMEQPWLGAGGLFGKDAAAKLAGLQGLVMEATFPLPGGGRIEIATERLTEEREEPGDYDDPGDFGYARIGAPAKKSEKAEKSDKGPKPDGKRPAASK